MSKETIFPVIDKNMCCQTDLRVGFLFPSVCMICAKSIKQALGVSVLWPLSTTLAFYTMPQSIQHVEKSTWFGYLLFEYAINEVDWCLSLGPPGNRLWDRHLCSRSLLGNSVSKEWGEQDRGESVDSAALMGSSGGGTAHQIVSYWGKGAWIFVLAFPLCPSLTSHRMGT